MGQIEGSDIPQRLLRDTGSFVSIVKQELVPKRCYTNRTINLQFADGNISTVPTALMKINSECFSGKMEFAVLKNPVASTIVGNMRGVTENFGNRKITNEISQGAEPEIVENKPKFEQMQKVEVSPVAKHRKNSEPETSVKNSKQSTNEVENDSMKENKQCSKVFENSNQKNNLTMISMEQKSNVNNSKQLNLINDVDSIEVGNDKSFEVPTNRNTQILTLSENNEQEIIPINAVLTRNQARQLDNRKEPNMLLQIPDISTDKFKEMQKSDKGLDKFWKIALGKTIQDENSKAIFLVKKGLLYRRPLRPRGLGDNSDTQLVIPSELRHIVLRTAHESVLGCHMGTKKTTQRIQVNFWFDGIVGYTHRYCRSCDICQRTIKQGTIKKAPMLISKLSDTPFTRISCDLVGPIIPTSQNGYSYILTIIDLATRYPEAIPMKRITTSKVADALKDFFSEWVFPM